MGIKAGITAGIYFLKRLLNAARASFAVRGVTDADASGRVPFVPLPLAWPSRATVTLGENMVHSLAASLIAIRSGMGFKHWNLVDGSKCAHCLQQCSAVPHFGQFPRKSVSAGNAIAQL
jgi:hypothetical protein